MKYIDERVVETIRFLAVDAVEKANSGHPGLPMGAAAMTYVLWKDFLKGSATDPKWFDRDRFVLSAGHGSALLYTLLHLFGYDVTLEDLKQFRQLGSKTPGHPEFLVTPGVETTTGPLGQGFANAVGMAIAERRMAEEFNMSDYCMVDHYTYVLCGDGDLMEGVSAEAASLAGHLKLGKLIVLYDSNRITIDGNTDLAFTENVGRRFDAYGWEVIKVDNGNDYDQVYDAIKAARVDTSKPTLIISQTTIGYGSPNKAGKSSVHGSPLGKEELMLTKRAFNWDEEETFVIPDEVSAYMGEIIDKREIERFMWEERLEEYMVNFPDKGDLLKRWLDFETVELSIEDFSDVIDFNKADATRSSGGKIMNKLYQHVPNFMGGSADLNASTKTYLEGSPYFQFDNLKGNNIAFGIREHAMGAILNGMALHGGLRVFGSTFLVFADYMKPAIRLAALMELPVVFIFTHDSVGVGEDGPTHQPIEQLAMLRGIPNLNVYRPADSKETVVAWIEAMNRFDGPSALVLSRQNLFVPGMTGEEAHNGAYIVGKERNDDFDAVVIATGSEVSLAMQAKDILETEGIDIRVVSMPCQERFEQMSAEYKDSILPSRISHVVTVEAGRDMGWYRYAGRYGLTVSINRFGESGPGDLIMSHFGFEPRALADKIKDFVR
ncbi:MAG: transketolase [Clostridia bacterium]|nr:transketolase [Clostridia bacterium]